MKSDADFEGCMKVFTALGFDTMEFELHKTAEPIEEQFWNQFDGMYDLTEAGMREELPLFITDPNNRAKVEALIASYENAELK